MRQPRKVTLTHAGQDYFRAVQKALYEIDRVTQKLISTHKTGILHLSVAPAFLTRWLLPRISSFYEAQPDIQIEFSAATGLVDFDRDETDMSVYFGKDEWPDGQVEVQLLRRYQQQPVCNPNLLGGATIDTPEDVLRYTLLHVKKRTDEWHNWFEQSGFTYKKRKQGIYFSSGSLTTSAAINGCLLYTSPSPRDRG